jgi:hypothetical protein
MGWPLLIIAILLAATAPAGASCRCRCIEGEVVSICDNLGERAPACPTVCPLAPSRVAPQSAIVPPAGTTRCTQRQVFSHRAGRYRWRQVCE